VCPSPKTDAKLNAKLHVHSGRKRVLITIAVMGLLDFSNSSRFWVWGRERSIERGYYLCATC
jgi:hypothetical protein